MRMPFRQGEGSAGVRPPFSALSRRGVLPFHMIVNCAPPQPLCLPVIAPAQAWVRAGERRGQCRMRNSELGDGASASPARGGAVGRRRRGCPLALRFLSPCLASDHACCLPQERQTGTACEMSRSYSAHVGIAISAFSNPRAVIELCGFTSGMCVSLWRSRRRNEGTRGERSRRRGATAFCAITLALPCFPRGVRWG